MRHLHGQVTSEVPLHHYSRVGIGVEIPLESANLPTNCTDWTLYRRVNLGLETAQDQRRTDDLTRSQHPDDIAFASSPGPSR